MRALLTTIALLALPGAAMAQNSPYVARVLSYDPAPGQFVNVMPQHTQGEPADSVVARALACLGGGTAASGSGVSLGAFGGSITFAFDHPVVNVAGLNDFQVIGNGFFASGSTTTGSSEPGIVMVSRDANGNGVADDPWYELAGSEHSHPLTQQGYTITYYRTPADHVPTPENMSVVDTTYIRWASNDALNPDSTSGYIPRLSFHTQDYWPGWIEADSLTFTGTKLRNNGEPASAVMWNRYLFDWGYADNRPDWTGDTDAPLQGHNAGFNIEWAVDSQGNHVTLPQIHFIRVYTAVNQSCGWTGETSTEVFGAIDFHPAAVAELPGDVNGDGIIDASDVSTLVNMILGNAPMSGIADVNGDGSVDASDVSALVSMILGQ